MKTWKEKRKTKGYTQAYVAIKANLSLTGYQNIEKGLSNPKTETQEKLKKILG